MNRIDRLLAIILLLQSKKIVRAQDIARHFRISERTVYRDISALADAGIPFTAAVGEGYSLADGFHLPPIMFTQEEAGALFIGGEFVNRLTDESVKKHIKTALMKIRSVLPNEKRNFIEKLQERTEIFTRRNQIEVGFRDDVLTIIQEAVVSRRVLTLEYYSNHRNSYNTRDIESVGLIYYGEHWHIIAYCRLQNDFRDFRSDRIKSISARIEIFSERKSFDLKRYIKELSHIKNPIEVRVIFDRSMADSLPDKYYFGLVEEKENTNGIAMTFLVPSLAWIARWLLSYGLAVKVEYPAELSEIIIKQAEEVIEYYRN